MVTEVVAAITGAQAYYHARNSQLCNGGFSDTLGSDLIPDGRLVMKDFRRVVKPRSAVGSGFSAHNNGTNTVVANLSQVALGRLPREKRSHPS
jgi:hypothetical protein